ncbi:unnamed protein product [Psylliodes chrysocephalus]|uniref:Uncharacterized protein n=1 Tax=Psylliodes chrysocephalus TaxID=3402493 RepID=A0A9P0CIA1_9CUCU|nr:unnamed protein product [Psylliodes chrysocephala]
MDKLDKLWVPHKVGKSCVESLRLWKKGEHSELNFGILMIWMEPKNHFDDFYFCVVDAKGFNQNQTWRYPELQSTKCPVIHSENRPRPIYISKVVRMPSAPMMLPNSQKMGQSTSGSEWEGKALSDSFTPQAGVPQGLVDFLLYADDTVLLSVSYKRLKLTYLEDKIHLHPRLVL